MADREASSPISLRSGAPVIVAAAAVISGLPVLFNDFAWDDTYLVPDNPAIRDLSNAPDILASPWASGVGYALGDVQNRPYYRPLALLSMAVDHAVAGGPDPRVFHATNLLIHVLAAVFLLLWLRRIWPRDLRPTPGAGEEAGGGWGGIPMIIAVLWAVHPVHTEAVALVTYRTSLLAGLFTFAGLWVLARSGDGRPAWPRVAGGLLCFALGLLSKETMLVFPALLLLADLVDPTRPTVSRDLLRRLKRVYLPLALLAVAWWAWRSHVTAGGIYDWFEGLQPWQKALMVPRVFFLYVRLCLLPYPLCPFYDWDILGVPASILEPDILAGLVLLIGIVAGAVLLRGRMPEVAFGFAFFLLALLPVSHLVPFFDAAGERFLYVPLAGMLVAGVGLVRTGLGVFESRGSWSGLAFVRRALLVIVVATFSVMTLARHAEWRDSETVLEASRRDFPFSVSANLGLGRLLLAEDRFAEAVVPLADVVRLSPRLSVGFGLLAAAQALSGDIRAARDTLTRAPLPEPRLPSAAQIARGELLRRGAADTARRVGL